METWISQQNSLWAQDFLYYLLFEGLGEGRGLHSSPLFRLSNPAVTQPTNRMPSSWLCHLYLSESWRVNKDISSTALVRLLVFTENECGRAEDGWGAESSSAVGLAAEKQHDAECQQGGDRNVMCQCGTLGGGACRRKRCSEENDQFIFPLHAKSPKRLWLVASSDLFVSMRPRHSSRTLIMARLSSASPRFSNCDSLESAAWHAGGWMAV